MHNSATDPQTEYPDTNPIKNLWQELKEYVRHEVKPLNQQELVTGIMTKKCIGHLRKVLAKLIELLVQRLDNFFFDFFLSLKLYVVNVWFVYPILLFFIAKDGIS